MPSITKSTDITIHREFDAPLQSVWDAWTKLEQLEQWWGPRGFSITTHSRDLQSGGTWSYVMHGPDGVNYDNHMKYLEVSEPKKLVYEQGGSATSKRLFTVTVMFSEEHGKTKMDMTMKLPTAEAAETTRQIIKKANGFSTWDRLAEFLEKKLHGKEIFVLNRSFDAPIDQMFKMWTEPEQITQWTAPTGFGMKYRRCELKEGGSAFYSMSNDSGLTMYGRCEYKQLRKPNRITYVQQFCDENEKVSRHPMSPTWPEDMLTTVELIEEASGTTRVALSWEPAGSCTQEEIQTFANARNGMTQGWTGSFDKLEEHLQTQNH